MAAARPGRGRGGRADSPRSTCPRPSPRTSEINGKQTSVTWTGVLGSRRARRTSAFCESARQHVGVDWTLPALAFAQQEL
jgi:hypothetical protein